MCNDVCNLPYFTHFAKTTLLFHKEVDVCRLHTLTHIYVFEAKTGLFTEMCVVAHITRNIMRVK